MVFRHFHEAWSVGRQKYAYLLHVPKKEHEQNLLAAAGYLKDFQRFNRLLTPEALMRINPRPFQMGALREFADAHLQQHWRTTPAYDPFPRINAEYNHQGQKLICASLCWRVDAARPWSSRIYKAGFDYFFVKQKPDSPEHLDEICGHPMNDANDINIYDGGDRIVFAHKDQDSGNGTHYHWIGQCGNEQVYCANLCRTGQRRRKLSLAERLWRILGTGEQRSYGWSQQGGL